MPVMKDAKGTVTVYEVGPRDGLQNQSVSVPTRDKLKYIKLLSQTGLRFIEVTSFVRAGIIPQLSDAQELSDGLTASPQVCYAALVPNLKGLESAREAIGQGKITEIAVFTAASETFTKKNINATISESLDRIRKLMKTIQSDPEFSRLRVRGYISTVVDCPYEASISPEAVLEVTRSLLDMGIYQVSLGETIGTAVPPDICRLLDLLCSKVSPDLLAGHFHDTRGTALANVFAALKYKIRTFDSSSAGLGGCPYAPGAAGNLATEDLVYALERSGYQTGVDLSALARSSRFILRVLDRPAASRVLPTL